MGNAQALKKFDQFEIAKLLTIIDDDGFGKAKVTNNKLLDEVLHLNLRYFSK